MLCHIIYALVLAIFMPMGNPGLTRKSQVTPGLRKKCILETSNPGGKLGVTRKVNLASSTG